MKPHLRNTLFALGMGLLYAYLFYHQEFGLNVFAFDAVLLVALLWLRPELGRQTSFRWAVAPLLVSALSVFIVSSPTSLLAHTVSLAILIGYAQARELRFVWAALLLCGYTVFAAPVRWWRQRPRTEFFGAVSSAVPWFRQAVTPLLIAFPFLVLYSIASNGFLDGVGDFLSFVFDLGIHPSVLWFGGLTFIGTLLVLPLAYFGDEKGVSTRTQQFRDVLRRERKPRVERYVPVCRTLALKRQYQRAVLTFAVLNLLIFFINFSDMRDIWTAGSRVQSPYRLSQYVHAGTDSLILSILLAMSVVLVFFRGNLNFYSRAKYLKPLACLWIAQNAVLALSVGVRNWHYIDAYGLAFGRIQVGFVLLLILVGLFTLYRKVEKRLSLTYLLQANGLSVWLFLVAFGAVNWVGVITRVNLTHETEKIDWDYLVRELGADNTFLLRDETYRIPAAYRNTAAWRKSLDSGVYTVRDWRELNYADWRNLERIKK